MQKILKTMARLCVCLTLLAAISTVSLCPKALAFRWFWQEEEAEETFTEATLAPLPTETAVPTPTPVPGPVASKLKDDGMLRVYLKSLGEPESLTLTLDGVYTVDHNAGFRFERGAKISLFAREGYVLLSAGGIWLNVGPELRLTRQAAEDGGESGVYIRESEKETLYCGDLCVSVGENGLRAILSIQVEDYLYGVVAYEMSDSFPLEALKAQAVAARTYAMGKKWTSAAKEYDLVDTPADQVYKGLDASYQNVIAAVDSTRGVVGTYKGGFANCYYTASNGGQTALPTDVWSGSGDYGYLDTRDDPYDLENPRSLVNSARFSPDLQDSPALRGLLEAALQDQAPADGELRVDRVRSVLPTAPKRTGSRMYERLRFTVEASSRTGSWAYNEDTASLKLKRGAAVKSAAALYGLALAGRFAWTPGEWTAQESPMEVELSVYDDIKPALSLGLNSLDCELISVDVEATATGEPTAFTLYMRRFGHGVGMSQRGAQRMAGVHGIDHLSILAFYYPGMTLEIMEWPEQKLESLEALPVSPASLSATATPRPTPAPLPALKEGEVYAVVRLESAGSTLNVREAPSTSARVLDAFPSGRELIIVSDAGDGWVRVRTAELEGYVKREYLELK